MVNIIVYCIIFYMDTNKLKIKFYPLLISFLPQFLPWELTVVNFVVLSDIPAEGFTAETELRLLSIEVVSLEYFNLSRS